MLVEIKTDSFVDRIKNLPMYNDWDYAYGEGIDSITEEAEVDLSGLNDHEIFAITVYAWNKIGYVIHKGKLKKLYGWSDYKIKKLSKEIKGMKVEACFSERTGLLSGSGYYFESL